MKKQDEYLTRLHRKEERDKAKAKARNSDGVQKDEKKRRKKKKKEPKPELSMVQRGLQVARLNVRFYSEIELFWDQT